jgi:hypothetical protein
LIAFKQGQSRLVVVLPWIAVKLPRSRWGARCNLYEAKLYKSTTPWRRKLLCQVIWCGPRGIVLVMRAASPLTDEEFCRADGSKTLPNWKRVTNSDEVEPFEDKPTDFGKLDGGIVVTDYAAHPSLIDSWVEPYTDEYARKPGYEHDFDPDRPSPAT